MDSHCFSYDDSGNLCCEDIALASIAEKYGTPLYLYSGKTIREQCLQFYQAFSSLSNYKIAYAVKANSNLHILNLFKEQNCCFDVVSGGEFQRILKIGVPGSFCFFSGVGKTEEEITLALQNGIYSLNVESESELIKIEKIASRLGIKAPIALRINPEIERVDTHDYTITGKSENKFGISFPQIEKLYAHFSQSSAIEIQGLHLHIGSQITCLENFTTALKKIFPLIQVFHEKYSTKFFSIGGGLGIPYENVLEARKSDWYKQNQFPTIQDYAKALLPFLSKIPSLEIIFEPGRYLVGNSGILITKCLYKKDSSTKNFRIVDAGMNDLLRPSLYQANHEIIPLKKKQNGSKILLDVVGPVCETGDFFSKNKEMEDFEEGEFIALMSSGAYSSSMGSTYNSRYLPPEILIDQKKIRLIRKRQSFENLISLEEF